MWAGRTRECCVFVGVWVDVAGWTHLPHVCEQEEKNERKVPISTGSWVCKKFLALVQRGPEKKK